MRAHIGKSSRKRSLVNPTTLPRSKRLHWQAESRRALPLPNGTMRCKRKFLKFFPDGFYDETYVAWERGYKWKAHEQWTNQLEQRKFQALLRKRNFAEVARVAVNIESRTNLLFSFEKMALRDAVKAPAGARAFAKGLYAFLHGPGSLQQRFQTWCNVIAGLPRRQTRVLTWPMVTIFGFIARPSQYIFLKPMVTRKAAKSFGFDFQYQSKPSWAVYKNYLQFAAATRTAISDLRPRDQIDIQSFLWVLGSEEYE